MTDQIITTLLIASPVALFRDRSNVVLEYNGRHDDVIGGVSVHIATQATHLPTVTLRQEEEETVLPVNRSHYTITCVRKMVNI